MIIEVPNLWDYEEHGKGTVVEWFKREGEEVRVNDLLCQIMVVKSTNNVYSNKSGKVSKILAEVGTEVKPGDPLLEISELIGEVVAEEYPRETKETAKLEKIRATPSARRIAKEKNLDISLVAQEVAGKTVTARDVEEYLIKKGVSVQYTARKIAGLRKLISENMMKSIQNSAQLTLNREADITDLFKIREEKLREKGITYNDLISFFSIKTLEDHKYMNAHLVDEEIREYVVIHLGVSVQTDKGLMVIVVKESNRKDLFQLSRDIKDLVQKAKSGTASPDELTGSTFTVSNLGMVGIHYFTPIINPPEIAILGVGEIYDKLESTTDGIKFRKKIGLSLTIDHRAVDGYTASEFLETLADLLSKPEEIIGK